MTPDQLSTTILTALDQAVAAESLAQLALNPERMLAGCVTGATRHHHEQPLALQRHSLDHAPLQVDEWQVVGEGEVRWLAVRGGTTLVLRSGDRFETPGRRPA